MTTPSEREFLELAGTYLACRWKVMGHRIDGEADAGTLDWHLLGMVDYRMAMQLFVRQWKENPNYSERYPF
jgi:hypothetical protein